MFALLIFASPGGLCHLEDMENLACFLFSYLYLSPLGKSNNPVGIGDALNQVFTGPLFEWLKGVGVIDVHAMGGSQSDGVSLCQVGYIVDDTVSILGQ